MRLNDLTTSLIGDGVRVWSYPQINGIRNNIINNNVYIGYVFFFFLKCFMSFDLLFFFFL